MCFKVNCPSVRTGRTTQNWEWSEKQRKAAKATPPSGIRHLRSKWFCAPKIKGLPFLKKENAYYSRPLNRLGLNCVWKCSWRITFSQKIQAWDISTDWALIVNYWKFCNISSQKTLLTNYIVLATGNRYYLLTVNLPLYQDKKIYK